VARRVFDLDLVSYAVGRRGLGLVGLAHRAIS
jgi:hypothetical protein